MSTSTNSIPIGQSIDLWLNPEVFVYYSIPLPNRNNLLCVPACLE